jgi:tetratricopeptide (TPR) repeat protein
MTHPSEIRYHDHHGGNEMKRFLLPLCIVMAIILAMSGPAPARAQASGTIAYTFYSCEIDSLRSSRLIAGEKAKRMLAADMAEKLEQEARLRDLRLTKDRAATLMTVLMQVETLEEKWDGTVYTVTAGAAGGTDGILQVMRLVQEDRHAEQELFLSGKRANAVLQEIEDINRELRETRVERAKMDRYYKSLDELEAVNGYTRGLVLLSGGRLGEAVEVLTESINRDPSGARLHHYRGEAYAKMGNQSRALADYDRAIALDQRYAAPHLGRGEIMFLQGHRDNALAELKSAIAIDPSFTEAYLFRGIVYGGMGNNKRAIDDFTTTIALDPHLAIAYVYRGNAYGKMGYHRQAFTDYNRAISLDDTLWAAHLHSGVLYEKKRSYSRAHDEYSRVIELNARCSIAYSNRGRVHLRLGENEKALEDYDRAIELDPTLAVAYFKRGLTHMKVGHVDRALNDQKMAARLGWKAAQDFLSAKGIKW